MLRALLLLALLCAAPPAFAQIGSGGCGAPGTPPCTITGTISATNPSVGATGAASPSSATYLGVNSSGNLTGVIACDSLATYDTTTNGKTQLVALSSGKTIYVCGFNIYVGGTATNVSIGYGTGTNCASTYVGLTPAYQIAANGGIVVESPFFNGMKSIASNELCISTSAGNAVQAQVKYTLF